MVASTALRAGPASASAISSTTIIYSTPVAAVRALTRVSKSSPANVGRTLASTSANMVGRCLPRWLLRRYAFVLVRNVPAEMDGVGSVVERIGPMRRTNWGGIADVKAIANAYDLTMTTRTLEPHTDNPYREPVPGYIFLHCLINNADGGDSTITDGFRVAEELREKAPEAFEALTRVRPDFTYVDDDTVLENSGPLIELDPQGRVRQVRLSNRTDSVAALDADFLDQYYRARRTLTDTVNDPAFQLQFKLGPGDLLIMDNYRLYHGRLGYRPGTGDRHMRQCYMDRDSVGSRRKVLARTYAK